MKAVHSTKPEESEVTVCAQGTGTLHTAKSKASKEQDSMHLTIHTLTRKLNCAAASPSRQLHTNLKGLAYFSLNKPELLKHDISVYDHVNLEMCPSQCL